MGLSVLCLGAKFSAIEYAGAAIIFVGLGVDIAPSVTGAAVSHGTDYKWAGVFLLGQVPAAVCSVYQEIAFREAPLPHQPDPTRKPTPHSCARGGIRRRSATWCT
jgi:hypothetical protein